MAYSQKLNCPLGDQQILGFLVAPVIVARSYSVAAALVVVTISTILQWVRLYVLTKLCYEITRYRFKDGSQLVCEEGSLFHLALGEGTLPKLVHNKGSYERDFQLQIEQ